MTGEHKSRQAGPIALRKNRSERSEVIIKLIIGLVVPFVAVNCTIPFLNDIGTSVFNIPFIFVWLFVWFVLTSGCLAICWFCFDRYHEDPT